MNGLLRQVTHPLSLLAQHSMNARQRPRSRSEWETRFNHWRRPESETGEAKIEAARRRVQKALARSHFLHGHQWEIIDQGSYNNNTNVRADSDVDLCVCLKNVFVCDGPWNDPPTREELGNVGIEFTYEYFRSEITSCLRSEYGWASVDEGKKAIHLHKNESERVSVDVVPAYTYRIYSPRLTPLGGRNIEHSGVVLWSSQGIQITNFPVQHEANGTAKNRRTGYRYKHVVRILKWMRNHMAENDTLSETIRTSAKQTPSFLIECLVYNCPDDAFRGSGVYDDVASVLRYLRAVFAEQSRSLLGVKTRDYWNEVNGIKPLFHSDQVWTPETASAFVAAAIGYMEQ